jgi:peptide subunit release factor 1 (eRF1)
MASIVCFQLLGESSDLSDVGLPNLMYRAQFLEELIDLEIEPRAHFLVELHPSGYSVPNDWNWLPRSTHESDNGIVFITATVPPSAPEPRLAVVPPFPIFTFSETNSFDDLRRFVKKTRTVAIILLRLGHFAIAIAEDGELITTKTGSRYVKGQHRKGGQSSNRFRRNREKWIRELFDQAGGVANSRFREYPGHIDHLALGGDRVVLGRFLKRVKFPFGLGERVLSNRLTVSRPGRASLEIAVREAWSLKVYKPPV